MSPYISNEVNNSSTIIDKYLFLNYDISNSSSHLVVFCRN